MLLAVFVIHSELLALVVRHGPVQLILLTQKRLRPIFRVMGARVDAFALLARDSVGGRSVRGVIPSSWSAGDGNSRDGSTESRLVGRASDGSRSGSFLGGAGGVARDGSFGSGTLCMHGLLKHSHCRCVGSRR